MIVTFYEEQSNIIRLMISACNYAMIMQEKYVKEKLILSKAKQPFVSVSSLVCVCFN